MLAGGEAGLGIDHGDDHLALLQGLQSHPHIQRPLPGQLQGIGHIFQQLDLVAGVAGEPVSQGVRAVVVAR